jgi:hypothetical protein
MNNQTDLQTLAEIIEANSIWRPASIQQEPHTKLTQWRVMRVENKDIHFVGWAGYEGRVCSAVQSYDPSTKRGITRSGRIYELRDSSGYNGDAMYVWGRWMDMNDLADSSVEDITHLYEEAN